MSICFTFIDFCSSPLSQIYFSIFVSSSKPQELKPSNNSLNDAYRVSLIQQKVPSIQYSLFLKLIYLIIFIVLLMNQSVCSRASNASSQMLEQLANRSTSKFLRVQGSFNDQEMRLIWNALGLYVSRNLRMGRGVSVPKLGVFTFTPPEVRLKGVTNEKERDLKPRIPVFLIQKEFVKGLPLRTALFFHQQFGSGMRPYAALGATGDVPITKMNLLQVSTYANLSKDATELAINRIIKYISEKILSGQSVNLQIPHVGQLICRNNLVAVKFNEYLYRDTRTVLSQSLDERMKKGNMNLTTDNLKKFARLSQMNSKLANSSQQFLDIDDSTKNFLRTEFGFHSTDNKQVMKNSLTNFGRSFASREFDTRNNLLKSSQYSRLTQSGFLTNKVKSFNREYNMALRIVKEWVMTSCANPANSFKDFVKLTGKSNELMNENDVWVACQQISSDITEQQADQLFRLLDSNKDGFVTKDDWNQNISFDNNSLLKSTIEMIRRKSLKASQALTKMGLAGISKTDVHTLKLGLMKINQKLSEQQAQYLSRYIAKGRDEASIETVLQVLHLNESNNVIVDQQWEEKFLKRLRKKMYDRNILEQEFESKLRLYDHNRTGYIEQADLKSVLGELGISLTLSELVKIVKIFPINEKNSINYQAILEKLELTDIEDRQPITYEDFVKVMKQKFFNHDSIPVDLPISVRRLTSELQSTIFKSEQESHLTKFVKKMDVNQNDEISKEDIEAYKQQIRVKNPVSPDKSCPLALQTLLIKLREKTIKKKMSNYDLFNRLDTNKDGFITLEEWMKNIGFILPVSEQEKQLLFEYLDSSKLKMIDYKTFLSFMNGTGAISESEKFDWVDECIGKIQEWFRSSGTTVAKSFKLVDADGDCYISEKDLHKFLVDKIKYQPRELSHVRLQKILKVLDTYKRAKVDENDWQRLLNGEKFDWIKEAKQQIGIVLSKRYQSLSDAFYQITQGDKKLLFTAFKNWVDKSKALSGFIANQDIVKKIYSELDVHKKGYLLQNDFISCFGVFNWKSEQTKEFIHKLKSKFSSCEQAYQCMNAYNKSSLDFNRFSKFVEQLFGNRFKKIDAKNIWKNIAAGKNSLSLVTFRENFGEQWTNSINAIDKQFPKDDWQYEDYTIIKGTQTRTSQFEYHETEKLESQVRKIVKNVKEMLATSPKTLEQAFQEADSEKTGRVNNLQFKKAFRILNIALTSKQLDLLLNYADYKVQTLIDWKEFIKRFNLNEDQIQMNHRVAGRLQHLSDLLHYYMISPKDAFRKWNNPRTGYMNFEQFHKMIKDVYAQAKESLPELTIIKENYELIDVRRDGILDFQEFTQTFRNCKPPSLLMGTVPAEKKLLHEEPEDPEKNKPVRETEVPLFKHSPQYQEFVKFIGRNRKYIQEKLEAEVGKSQRLIPYEVVQRVVKDVASHNKLSFSDNIIRNSIAFSMTGEKVDYRMLTQSFKSRGEGVVEFPSKKVF